MDKGRTEFDILSNAHSREALLEHATNNGISWDETKHKGVNWMRASVAIVGHLSRNKDFFTDSLDPEIIGQMLPLYEQLIDLQKRTMLPMLRSAMDKLRSDSKDKGVQSIDLLEDAHVHLATNGGVVWSNKIYALRNMTAQVKFLKDRLESISGMVDSNGGQEVQ